MIQDDGGVQQCPGSPCPARPERLGPAGLTRVALKGAAQAAAVLAPASPAVLSLLLACAPASQPEEVDLAVVNADLPVSLHHPRWPDPDARLTPPPLDFPAEFGVRRVFLDAGHGAARNTGNTSAFCEQEQDVMAALSSSLAAAMEATGHFAVRQSRLADEQVPYRDRLRAAQDWGAEAFISLHSDSRGALTPWEPEPGLRCYRSADTAGFSVLWSDEGSLADARLDLARALAASMAQAGFAPYDGGEYAGLYAPDTDTAGVFVDRHAPRRRIMFLRRPVMPSVIIETHHALDPAAAERFRMPDAQAAIHAAVIAGLVEWFQRTPAQ